MSDWPQFRGDSAHTATVSGFPPVPATGFTESLPAFAIDGIMNSSPAVVNGTVYCASDHVGVFALDDANQLLWSFQAGDTGGGETFGPGATPPNSNQVSYSSPALMTAGEGVYLYIHADNGYLYCLDAATGTAQWGSAYLTGQVPSLLQQTSGYLGRGFISSPVVADGVVYVGSEDAVPQADPHGGHLHCVDALTGAPRWGGPFAVSGAVNSSPAVAGGVVYFGSTDWVTPPGSTTTGAPLPVFVSPNNWIPSQSPPCWVSNLHCLDTTGPTPGLKQLASVPNGGVYASPTVAGGVVYFATAGQPLGESNGVEMYNGTLYALDAETGQPKWLNPFTTNGYIVSSPAVSGALVFIGTYNGDIGLIPNQEVHNLFAINALDGTVAWTFVTDGWVVGSPAVAEGTGTAEDTVYACSSGGHLYAIGASDGSLSWSTPVGAQVSASPAIADACVYVAAQATSFTDPTGNLLHRFVPAI